jgi:L-lactate dehydrogenase complex protein LldG
MNPGRAVILGKIRTALREEKAGFPDGILPGEGRSGPGIPRNYRRQGTQDPGELLDLLHDRIVDYKAAVVRCRLPELPGAISRRLGARGVGRLVIPSDVPDRWLGEVPGQGMEVFQDLGPEALTSAQLSSAHAVLTGCALAIAETGTLVLDGGATQGRRILTLLPDYHLCVVFHHQVVETVPEAMEALGETVKETRAPLTLISGPSATSDIELIRVEGVHGPRTLDVILVEDP